MQQQQLFFEDLNEAIAHMVACMGGAKRVGAAMPPSDMEPDAAGRWIKDCLNPDRRETFHPEHLMFLLREGRKQGCHALMHYLAEQAGYTVPSPIMPSDEAADLMRQFIQSVELSQKIADQLQHLGMSTASAAVRAVK